MGGHTKIEIFTHKFFVWKSNPKRAEKLIIWEQKRYIVKFYQNDSFGLVQDGFTEGVTEGVTEDNKPECGKKFEMGFKRIV